MSGLYVHIPFCKCKCSYCAFYSVETGGQADIDSFVRVLGKELDELKGWFFPETVFVGGGTPTALKGSSLKEILQKLDAFSPEEFSVEVNPGTVNEPVFPLLRSCGVNRVSIGVQSFDAGCLTVLGRIHSADEAETAFHQARKAGFNNIGVDLIFGVPGQTMDILHSDLDHVLTLEPEHLSAYNLMYENGTAMAQRSDRLDEGLEREMYDVTRTRLMEAGYEQYEISNFARPGFECRHNLLYWTGGEYIGCGPAAHSHLNGVRRENAPDLDDYCLNGPRCVMEESLDPAGRERERMITGLRLLKGVEVLPALWESQRETLEMFEREGLLVMDGRHVRLSDDGLFVSDSVFAELV